MERRLLQLHETTDLLGEGLLEDRLLQGARDERQGLVARRAPEEPAVLHQHTAARLP